MQRFNTFTLIVASVVFLGLFIYTAVIYYNNTDTLYPRDVAQCPDFWSIDSSGACVIPTNGINIGDLSGGPVELYTYTFGSRTGTSYLKEYDHPTPTLTKNPKAPLATPTKIAGTKGPQIILFDIYQDIPSGYDRTNPGVIDFEDKGWGSYGDPNCAIKKWVNQHNISWDGISNYNKC
jgi:hypothetical protein